MPEDLLTLEITDGARIAYSSMSPEDQRLLDAWFDHLRNWRNDNYIQSKAKPHHSEKDTYLFPTSTDLVIAFKIIGNSIVVLSIFRKEAFYRFQKMTQPSIP